MIARDRYHVYVDEAGDRGWGSSSSPVFVLSAVVVHDSADQALRDALDAINMKIGRQPGQIVHWKENLRDHADRKMAAATLGAVGGFFINIVLCKDRSATPHLSDPIAQYNYLLRLLLERVSWLMDQQSPQGLAQIHLAHIRRFKYAEMHSYLALLRQLRTNIIWGGLDLPPKIEAAQDIRGLQAADILAGCVFAAVRPDRHGDHEAAYLVRVAPRLWTGRTGKLETYGLKFLGPDGCTKPYTWLAEVRAIAEGRPADGPL